ncbi:hypothetical protein B602_0304 [Chlamydia psittaci M56]|nr:hypothetical protein B602_0304 [Chlamydia psittaci M56]
MIKRFTTLSDGLCDIIRSACLKENRKSQGYFSKGRACF